MLLARGAYGPVRPLVVQGGLETNGSRALP
jgi:hypothetical protein